MISVLYWTQQCLCSLSRNGADFHGRSDVKITSGMTYVRLNLYTLGLSSGNGDVKTEQVICDDSGMSYRQDSPTFHKYPHHLSPFSSPHELLRFSVEFFVCKAHRCEVKYPHVTVTTSGFVEEIFDDERIGVMSGRSVPSHLSARPGTYSSCLVFVSAALLAMGHVQRAAENDRCSFDNYHPRAGRQVKGQLQRNVKDCAVAVHVSPGAIHRPRRNDCLGQYGADCFRGTRGKTHTAGGRYGAGVMERDGDVLAVVQTLLWSSPDLPLNVTELRGGDPGTPPPP